MKDKRVIILGVGGNSVDILDLIDDINSSTRENLRCVGFLDDKRSTVNQNIRGIKLLGSLNYAKKFTEAYFINGIGSPNSFLEKENIIAKTAQPLNKFLTLIHPSVNMSQSARIGSGTVIFQNVVIASNAKIGNHVMILPNTVISHDDIIGDYSSIASGVCIAGRVTIGKVCYLGMNSAVKEDSTIADYSLVGMGSVVLGDIPVNSIFAGNPAKFLKSSKTKL